MPNEQKLSDVLSEFARTMLTDFPIQAILDQLVKRIVDVLAVGSAGVTLISSGSAPHFVAASNDAALLFEQLQSSLDDGPCIAAYETGEAVSVPDLSAERLPGIHDDQAPGTTAPPDGIVRNAALLRVVLQTQPANAKS